MLGLGIRLVGAETVREIDVSSLALATGVTVGVAFLAALVALLLAVPVAALAARYSGKWVAGLETLAYLPHAIPGIVIGLSLVFFSLAVVPPLYQTTAVLVFAYAVLFMPKAPVTARASINVCRPPWSTWPAPWWQSRSQPGRASPSLWRFPVWESARCW